MFLKQTKKIIKKNVKNKINERRGSNSSNNRSIGWSIMFAHFRTNVAFHHIVNFLPFPYYQNRHGGMISGSYVVTLFPSNSHILGTTFIEKKTLFQLTKTVFVTSTALPISHSTGIGKSAQWAMLMPKVMIWLFIASARVIRFVSLLSCLIRSMFLI